MIDFSQHIVAVRCRNCLNSLIYQTTRTKFLKKKLKLNFQSSKRSYTQFTLKLFIRGFLLRQTKAGYLTPSPFSLLSPVSNVELHMYRTQCKRGVVFCLSSLPWVRYMWSSTLNVSINIPAYIIFVCGVTCRGLHVQFIAVEHLEHCSGTVLNGVNREIQEHIYVSLKHKF